MNIWQMPSGIHELRGVEALKIEQLKRQLIDLYLDNSYELIIPPLVSYVTSGNSTFKFSDNYSDNTLEIVADITPKIAIFDYKNTKKISKYCYINQIIKPYADDFYSSRSPIQVGAEIYGNSAIDADFEIINLMLTSLETLDIKNTLVVIGNIAIFNNIIDYLNLNKYYKILKDIFKRKSTPDLQYFINQHNLDNKLMDYLHGNQADLMKIFSKSNKIINEVNKVISLGKKLNNYNILYDFSDTKTYDYHNGIVFSAYNENYFKAIARGGRYDNLLKNKRPATGFSFDLKSLI